MKNADLLSIVKMRPTSIVGALPDEQRAAVERWLFEENLSYKSVRQKLLTEFRVRIATSSLCEWRKRRAQQRQMNQIIEFGSTSLRKGQLDAAESCLDRFAAIKMFADNDDFDRAQKLDGIAFVLFSDAKSHLLKEVMELAQSAANPPDSFSGDENAAETQDLTEAGQRGQDRQLPGLTPG